jgi:heme/copper-type cytochrome/quinol oxidase subunit 4
MSIRYFYTSFSALAVALILPTIADAVTLAHTLKVVSGIINAVIPIILALAVLLFFWGLAMYMLKAGEEKQEGINIMIMGTIAIFVMVSIWGIIRVLQQTFQVDSAKPIIPDVIERGYYAQ